MPIIIQVKIFSHCHIVSLKTLRSQVSEDHSKMKKTEFEAGPKASEGYGGKFGVMKDRMDKV